LLSGAAFYCQGMNAQLPRNDPDKSRKPPRIPKDFLAGIGVGVVLWIIIAHAVENWLLGALFGLVPGLVIGLALQFTHKEK